MNQSETDSANSKVADALKQSWVYRYLPQSVWPYAQLARWERPIGWQLLMWPGLWSIVLASGYGFPDLVPDTFDLSKKIEMLARVTYATVLPDLLLFVLGAIVMRGAGCTYNDLADQDIDARVARTQSRPLPSGRVTRNQAIGFMAIQLLVGLLILLQFSTFAFWVGAASIVTIAVYPFMKRITWWPQLFLGFAFSWGALLGWATQYSSLSMTPILLYCGSILWVIGYDTIYAHQDREDDALVGVKSTARLFGSKSRLAISVLYGSALALFAAAITSAYIPDIIVSLPAYLAIGMGGWHMYWQLAKLDIDDPDQCLKLFKSNNQFGFIIFAGLTGSMALSVLL